MNISKRIGLMSRISKGFRDRGLNPPGWKLPNGKRLSSSRFRQIVRMYGEELVKFDAEQATPEA